MKEKLIKIDANDGQKINLQIYEPENQDASVTIVGVHGFGEFAERYSQVARFFTDQGAAFYIHDQRGHGLASGKRGTIDSYENFLDDLDAVIEKVREEQGNKPVVIYGHSMGGNIALNYLMTRKNEVVVSSIISSPWLKLYKNTPLFLVKAMERVLGPDFTIKAKIGYLSHDREHLKEVNQKGLYHNYISAAMARGVMESGLFIMNNPGLLTTPALLMSAEKDNVVDLKSIDDFVMKSGDNLRHIRWPEMYHELHNEKERQQVLAAAWDFILANI